MASTKPSIIDRVKQEPALLVGVIIAALLAAKGFGWIALTDDQESNITDLVYAVLTLLGAVGVRQVVTPNTKVAAKVVDGGTAGGVPPSAVAGQAAEDAGVAVKDEPVVVEPAEERDYREGGGYEPKHGRP